MKRNTLYSVIKMVTAGAVMGSLAACGGGSDGGNGNVGSTGGSVGPVSGFGSVYVNGTHFGVNGASYTGNDGVERYSQLEKGMIVKVAGSWGADGEGEASSIYYDDTLRGPVETMSWNVEAKAGVITIAGLDVAVNSRTVFKGATPKQLVDSVTGASAEDYRVRISGYRLADGSFQATFVGAKEIGSGWVGEWHKVEVEGVVSNLGTQIFEINGLKVDFQTAVFDDGAEEDLKEGVVVEVEGELENGKLIASEIEFEDDLFDNNDDVEISGAVTVAYDPDSKQFHLNGFAIQVDEETDLDDDITVDRLTEGAEIKVEGEYRNGIIVAEEIETRDGNAELSGFIESKEQGGEVLMVSGVRVTLTDSTLIEDEGTKDGQESVTMRTQDLESLNVDDYLEIEGRETTENGGGLIAFYIERDDDDELELEGKISSLTQNTVTVMGLELQMVSDSEGSLTNLKEGEEVEIEFKNVSGEYHIVKIQADD
ncbi:DUF5666 domain-containing protein [Marinobacter sp.]|uniref:DUF5666 domain-containing protein n=1 Tax=Marinobacter sp. TaxID=50741 RepID=UPI003F9DBB1A